MNNTKRISPMQVQFWTTRINPETNQLYTESEAKTHIQSFRKCNKLYWIKRGFSEDEAQKRVDEFQAYSNKGSTKYIKEHPECCTTNVQYWINKGYSYEEAVAIRKSRQQTFSLEKCVKKYGEELGRKKWEERQAKWQNTLNSKTQEQKNEINSKKNIFLQFKGQIKNDKSPLFEDFKRMCISKGLFVPHSRKEAFDRIIDLYYLDDFSQKKGVDYFLNKKCPKYLYECFSITIEEMRASLEQINPPVPYLCGTTMYNSYHLAVGNTILLSSGEIRFYKLLCKYNINIDGINRPYPNSSLRYDFKIGDVFVEIAGLMCDKKYVSKMLYKRQTYNSFILTSKSEYDDFINRVIIQKNEEAIKYYSTRPLQVSKGKPRV